MKLQNHSHLYKHFSKRIKLLILFLSITIFTLISSPSYSQSLPQIQFPENASRGSIITFSLPSQSIPVKPTIASKDVLLILNGNKIFANRIGLDSRKNFLNTIDFIIPESTNLGKNSVRIDIKENNVDLKRIALPKPLNIVGSFGVLSPEVKAISKLVNFPEKDETYSFSVIGKNFSTDTGNDNKLFLSDSKNENGEFVEGKNVKVCWQVKEDKDCIKSIRGVVVNNRELKFERIPKSYAGELGIQIGVGDNFSNIYPTFLSPVLQETPKKWSGYITIGLITFICLIQASGFFRNKRLDRKQKQSSFLKDFFIESETNTLSLSRFQFYVWTLTAILSYLYLLFSRSLIQSKFEFIDIPSGLPTIILISATTTFLSLGISSNKGTKGAGDINPNWSDLITVGGVVAPERLQFLVWTILGSLVFLFITFFQNPEKIQDLPQVPQGFLQLMGVSSFGYIGGKLARKAGPIVNEVSTNFNGSTLVIDVRGSRLSQDAVFKIGNDSIVSNSIDGNKPQIITPEDSNELNLAKHLQLTIQSPPSSLINGLEKNSFQIVNPDGQYAEWRINPLNGLGTTLNPPPSQDQLPQSSTLDPAANSRTHRGLLDPDAK